MDTEPKRKAPEVGPGSEPVDTPFVNGVRLGVRQWLVVGGVVAAILCVTPVLWERLEHFETGPDYRIPYALSRDYWLYARRLAGFGPTNIAVVGDSVVWGEYVRPDGTLSHFLNEQWGQPGRFLNAGVNGLFPLALEGLIRHDGAALRDGKVILHCNVLWMSSPKADLQTEKEERFNHAELVPQFVPRIPCYKSDLNRRLVAVLERESTFLQWANHLQIAYFGQQNIQAWTLMEDGSDPPRLPNAFKDPLAQITLRVPSEPLLDPDRGPASPRHRPWSTVGEGSTRFEWVAPEHSLQWGAFKRLVDLLQSRGNEVLVLVGPFNEHLLAADNRPAFRRWIASVSGWLETHNVPHVVPPTLPSLLYADASHPLTEGYEQLAAWLRHDPVFLTWLGTEDGGAGPRLALGAGAGADQPPPAGGAFLTQRNP